MGFPYQPGVMCQFSGVLNSFQWITQLVCLIFTGRINDFSSGLKAFQWLSPREQYSDSPSRWQNPPLNYWDQVYFYRVG